MLTTLKYLQRLIFSYIFIYLIYFHLIFSTILLSYRGKIEKLLRNVIRNSQYISY